MKPKQLADKIGGDYILNKKYNAHIKEEVSKYIFFARLDKAIKKVKNER